MCIRDSDHAIGGRGDACGHANRLAKEVVDFAAQFDVDCACLLYTSDAADERSSVDLGGRRIIKKKNKQIS